MRKTLSTTNIWAFIFAFILISILVYMIINLDKQNRIKNHLENSTHIFSTQYNTVYNSYKNMSETAHSIIFDSPLITDILEESLSSNPMVVNKAREKLYNLLKNKYDKLQKLGFEQLHFHTKDNKSFLRMHQPNTYGDDLNHIRYSVEYVNKHKKYIHGLEAGRIVHGFRFVYPMYSKKEYLGSVEFSISSDAFIKSIEKSFDTDIHFIVNKKLVYSKLLEKHKDKYKQSIESNEYLKLIEKDGTGKIIKMSKEVLREKIGDKIDTLMKKDEAFSLYIKNDDQIILGTFLPIKNIKHNKTVAYIISYTSCNYLKSIFNDFGKIYFFLEFLIALFLYFIYLLNKSKQKLIEDQKIISENSRLNSMSEIIGNIAHHWRQPLSVISTIASSLKVHHELNILKDEYLEKSLNNIVKSTKDLSKTIDDFKDYLTSEKEISTFYIDTILKKVYVISNSSIKNNYINFIKNINYEKEITTIESTLVESIIKILNNSIEVLQKIKQQDDRFIFLDIKEEKETLVIQIKDSAGGIDNKIIEHIFDPYFTTKHQSVGKGLGLYTVRTNIVNILHGKIKVENISFEYKNKSYKGAMFTITLKPNI